MAEGIDNVMLQFASVGDIKPGERKRMQITQPDGTVMKVEVKKTATKAATLLRAPYKWAKRQLSKKKKGCDVDVSGQYDDDLYEELPADMDFPGRTVESHREDLGYLHPVGPDPAYVNETTNSLDPKPLKEEQIKPIVPQRCSLLNASTEAQVHDTSHSSDSDVEEIYDIADTGSTGRDHVDMGMDIYEDPECLHRSQNLLKII
ncbi:uncharacterized protein [Amphiura filiformis]|uniref:uncharacterized protein isoform X2 n=1 Tax=Amphiura filiformis TaxID=82378 RepID=UPI003B21ED3A